MAAIIRLSRHGKKGQAFYHIVVADSRFARDARFIEKLGTYNPRNNPVTVDIKFDNAVSWIQKGAKPSDTMRSILSNKGVLYKAHLLKGVTKGVLTLEQADAKFNKWLTEKDLQVNSLKSSLEASKKEAYKKRIAAESASRQTKTAKKKQQAEPSSSAAPAETPAEGGQ
jgi:small subunit ribosomal protein S16